MVCWETGGRDLAFLQKSTKIKTKISEPVSEFSPMTFSKPSFLPWKSDTVKAWLWRLPLFVLSHPWCSSCFQYCIKHIMITITNPPTVSLPRQILVTTSNYWAITAFQTLIFIITLKSKVLIIFPILQMRRNQDLEVFRLVHYSTPST